MTSLINKAARLIGEGKLVAFPTETVYGIGANALDDNACQKIYQIKGRPSNNPLIVHVSNINEAKKYAIFNMDAEILAKFWPGPITLILPKTANCPIAKTVTANLDTIAIRMPSHPIALELITKAKCPIAAPSANKSGKLSATTDKHVKNNFTDNKDLLIIPKDDTKDYGLESTIIDLTTNVPTILRFGYITPEEISSILAKEVAISANLTKQIDTKPLAPGMLLKHYSPETSLRLNATNLEQDEVGLNFASSNLQGDFCLNLSKTGDLAEAAANLYSYLYQLDLYAIKNNYARIAVSLIPNTGIGLAINDRLQRASN
ncbi:MAG: threonylcarbamoyl-AMP synthase [Rickettsiaceae bacterium]|nr:threonylcarbamoyl-AMP synthase [Rickettsiaceae bacterium]